VGEAVDEMVGVGGTSTVPETAMPTVAAVLSGLTDVWSVERMGSYEVYASTCMLSFKQGHMCFTLPNL